MLIVIFFQLPIEAENTENTPVDLKYKIAIETLEQCGLVDNVYNRWTNDSLITRREALEILCDVKGGLIVGDITMEQFELNYSDITDYTDDSRLVITASFYGYFKGRVNENMQTIADLNAILTYDEAQLFYQRLVQTDKSTYIFDKIGEMTAYDYLLMIYDAIHYPVKKYTYGGEVTEYYIDNLFKRQIS